MSATYVAIRISWWHALNQCWHGRRDGKREIPEFEPDAGTVPPTPHDHSLLRRRDEVTQHVRLQVIRDTAETCRRIEEHRRRAELLEAVLAERQDELRQAEAEPSEAQLPRRGPGESALAESAVRFRRNAERNRQLAPRQAAVAGIRAELDDLHARLADLETHALTEVRAAQSRAAQYCAFTDALRARYWRALLRVHSRRSRMLEGILPRTGIPGWIDEPGYREVLGLVTIRGAAAVFTETGTRGGSL